MNQNKVKMLTGIASIFFAVLFVVLLIFGIAYSGSTLAKVLLFVVAFLTLALGLELGYLFILSGDTKPNYFLFNEKSNRNIPVQKLTFQTINVRMNKFLSAYAPSEGRLWTDRALDNPYLEMNEDYKPIVAYKLIFDLAERDAENGWRCFLLASEETVEFIALGLDANGDTEMAKTLRRLKAAKPLNLKQVRDYLVGNRKYIQNKMYRYVVDNIEKF